jgi:hypothetical protein
MQQLYPDDGVAEEDTDVPGVLRGKVILQGADVSRSQAASSKNTRIRIPSLFDIHTPGRF